MRFEDDVCSRGKEDNDGLVQTSNPENASCETNERDRDDVEDDNTVTRIRTKRRSAVERSLLSDLCERSHKQRRMTFEDMRGRLFRLTKMFDEVNERTVCDTVRSFTLEFFTSLYDMSYLSYKFFDDAVRQAYKALPVATALSSGSIGRVENCAEWLTLSAIEDFSRVLFYRLYEYLRCWELQRAIIDEAFDRDECERPVAEIFLGKLEERRTLDELRREHWKTFLTKRSKPVEIRSASDALYTIVKFLECARVVEESATMRSNRAFNGAPKDDKKFVSSIDLALMAALRQREEEISEDVEELYESLLSTYERSEQFWPVWNLPLSRRAVSISLSSIVCGTERNEALHNFSTIECETLRQCSNAKDLSHDEKKLWSRVSAERYDYMSFYRNNARYDKYRIRNDCGYYSGILNTFYDFLIT